ncbi:MAG: 6-phosphofructokinase [Candidatus Kapabacteria bacterium]|nr:6-phosphofructokinase [Candidatus Kapabacteria bacterium]
MRCAVLTGGGDCPGMNAFIRAVVRTMLNLSPESSVWGVLDGWRGLVYNEYRSLGKRDVSGIAALGGTILGTMRFPELATNRALQERAARNLEDQGFDYLFVIGGNGSVKAAWTLEQILRREGWRTRILVAAGSIDNDVCNNYGTSIGFYSALERSLEMLGWIRDTASSHRRVYLIRSMGRDSAYLAFYAGIIGGAEYAIRPHETVDFERLAEIAAQRDRDTIIVVAEAYPKSLQEIQQLLEEIFRRRGIDREIRAVDMSYFQRGGKASVTDILRASWLGYRMVCDAHRGCSSGFYTAYYIGHVQEPLSLELAADDTRTSHLDIPQEVIRMSLALR